MSITSTLHKKIDLTCLFFFYIIFLAGLETSGLVCWRHYHSVEKQRLEELFPEYCFWYKVKLWYDTNLLCLNLLILPTLCGFIIVWCKILSWATARFSPPKKVQMEYVHNIRKWCAIKQPHRKLHYKYAYENRQKLYNYQDFFDISNYFAKYLRLS